MKNKKIGIAGRQRLTWPVIEGIGATAAMLGAPDTLLKAIKRKGSRAFMTGNRVDTGILIPEIIAELLSKKNVMLDPAQEKAMLDKERRLMIERQNSLEEHRIHDLLEVEKSVRTELLLPLRDGLQGLQKKFARLKKSKPEIATQIIETDLPKLLEKITAEK